MLKINQSENTHNFENTYITIVTNPKWHSERIFITKWFSLAPTAHHFTIQSRLAVNMD